MESVATASLPISTADNGTLSQQAQSTRLMGRELASATTQDVSAEQTPSSTSFAAHLDAEVNETSAPETLDNVNMGAPVSPTIDTMKRAQLPQMSVDTNGNANGNANQLALVDGQELPPHLQELPVGAIASGQESDAALPVQMLNNDTPTQALTQAPIESAPGTPLDKRALSAADAAAIAGTQLELVTGQQSKQALEGELATAETLTQDQLKARDAVSVTAALAQQKSVKSGSDIGAAVAEAGTPSLDDAVMEMNAKPKAAEFELLAPTSLRRDVSMPQLAGTAQTSVSQVTSQLPSATGSSVTTETGLKLNVEVEVQSARWGEAIGAHMTKLVRDGQRSAQLVVNPPQLGPVEVSVNVDNEHATVSFSAPASATREALESALPRLREMLAEGGFSSADVDVSSGGEHEGAERDSSSASGSNAGINAATDELGESDSSIERSVSVGLLDTYV